MHELSSHAQWGDYPFLLFFCWQIPHVCLFIFLEGDSDSSNLYGSANIEYIRMRIAFEKNIHLRSSFYNLVWSIWLKERIDEELSMNVLTILVLPSYLPTWGSHTNQLSYWYWFCAIQPDNIGSGMALF